MENYKFQTISRNEEKDQKKIKGELKLFLDRITMILKNINIISIKRENYDEKE
jgi:FtsH-binding integral membrane protein